MHSGSPERFAMSKPQPPAGSTDRTYILRIYVAAPGTPVQPPGADSAQRSAAGHVYFSVSDGSEERGYGFSPIESGTRGPGHVVRDEHRAYQEPAYIRTMEISKAQYDSLQMYGEAAVHNDERHFSLQYNGATNSCIDFTWGALNHAGLHREHRLPFGYRIQDKDYDGTVKPLDNIREFRRIPDPVPDSPYNQEQENALPERKFWQRLISELDVPRDEPGSDHRHAASREDIRGPFDDPVLNQMHAALQLGDGEAMDVIGRRFNRSEEGVLLAERGEQLHAAWQAHAAPEQHRGDALLRM